MAIFSVEPNERVTFAVHYEDEHLLVVAKPARMLTLPGEGGESGTLLNGLFVRYGRELQNLGRPRDFGLLHRLDRDTSGLLVVALRAEVYDGLRGAFERRDVGKYYWALARRAPSKPDGLINRPILESQRLPRTARISSGGRPALTAYRTLQAGEGDMGGSLLECRPITGRLHQVRLHLSSIGCPILGDDVYGSQVVAGAAPRLALHAHRLTFAHPATGERIDIRSRFPRDLMPTLRRMRFDPPSSAAGD